VVLISIGVVAGPAVQLAAERQRRQWRRRRCWEEETLPARCHRTSGPHCQSRGVRSGHSKAPRPPTHCGVCLALHSAADGLGTGGQHLLLQHRGGRQPLLQPRLPGILLRSLNKRLHFATGPPGAAASREIALLLQSVLPERGRASCAGLWAVVLCCAVHVLAALETSHSSLVPFALILPSLTA
jgi:hypothetical protein